MPSKDTTNKVVAVVAFVIIVGGVASYSMLGQQASTPVVTPSAVPTTTMSTPTSAMTVMPVITSVPTTSSTATLGSYKDGVYTVVGNYTSPGGPEHIDVNLTLKDGVVTAAEVTPQATLPMSQRFQGLFVSGYKEYVIGKKIDEISITKVSGSSLTPKGFADALAKIKAQAKA